MTEEGSKENIKLEMQQAEENLKEINALTGEELYRGAISRIYYYVFHVTRALLYSIGLEPKTHQGVNHLLNLHFVKPGKIDPKYGKLFSRLQKYREESDYDPAAVFTKEDAEEELVLARQYFQAAKQYLR